MAVLKLTDATVKAKAKHPPVEGRIDYFDQMLPGFGLRISSTGAASWFVFYRVDGQQVRDIIGRYPAKGLARARAVRPSMSDDPHDKLAAAFSALGHARLRESAEFKRRALYYDAVKVWFERLSEDDKELCRILADVAAGPHKAAAEGMAASLSACT